MVPAQAWRGPHRAGPLGASWEKAGLQDRSEGVIGPPSRPWRDERVDRAGIVQTGLTGSAEARAGLPRSYWSCPSEGQPGPGLKQHPRLRPFGITTRRSGRRSRNAKTHHGLRAPPGRSAPPRPVAHSRGRPKSHALSPCGRGWPREARSGEGSLRPQHRLRRPGRVKASMFERPLIRRPSAATFSRKGRRTRRVKMSP